MTAQQFSQICQGIGYIFQALGILGAGLFFGYRVWQGYHLIDLSVSVECKRQEAKDGKGDYLFVNVDLEKGERGSLTLHDAQVRLHHSGGHPCQPLIGTERSQRKPEEVPGGHTRQRLDWKTPDPYLPFLNLTPGDKTKLAALCRVPAGEACEVEVGLLGRRLHGPDIFGQWKASVVSLPLSQSKRDSEDI